MTLIGEKVLGVIPLPADVLQNTNIGTKLDKTDYNDKMGLLGAKYLLQNAAIDELLVDAEFQAKVDALEEYIYMVQLAYYLQDPNTGAEYEYNGTFQNIPFPSGLTPVVYPSI
jgi:hypothetical protein